MEGASPPGATRPPHAHPRRGRSRTRAAPGARPPTRPSTGPRRAPTLDSAASSLGARLPAARPAGPKSFAPRGPAAAGRQGLHSPRARALPAESAPGERGDPCRGTGQAEAPQGSEVLRPVPAPSAFRGPRRPRSESRFTGTRPVAEKPRAKIVDTLPVVAPRTPSSRPPSRQAKGLWGSVPWFPGLGTSGGIL